MSQSSLSRSELGDNDDGALAQLIVKASRHAERGAIVVVSLKRAHFALDVGPSGAGVQAIQHKAVMVPKVEKHAR